MFSRFELATWMLRSSASLDETNFAAQALAVFLFRLPFASTVLVHALETKEAEERKRKNTRTSSSSSVSAFGGGPPRRRTRPKVGCFLFCPFFLRNMFL
jgi:hypothetical protein